ncbi:YbjQ family protein [Granulosicoccus sp. 3-233]|uniref:YbjQ family protein n=1 Tax=Granulosicoccus sp. 3-233 TaxID=3417969 RepID=UPI003D33E1CA
MTSLLLQAGSVVALLVLGYLFGRLAEKRHYRRIIEQESTMQSLPVVASRYPPEDRHYHQQLVSGSVVIASDYFKAFLAGLINIFGGQVTPFESMLDRARREAVLRMKQEALDLDAAYVFNIKFDTTRIATGKVGAMEVLAYGTAMIPAKAAMDRSHEV